MVRFLPRYVFGNSASNHSRKPNTFHGENNHMANGVEKTDPIKILIALLLPPLAVFLEVGLGMHFWLNIVLCIFFWIPGILHAIYVVLTR